MTAVESGRALLLALAEQPRAFSLILTDVAMPDVNGLEVLRYVRSQPMLHSLPVIMMSAHENAGTGAPPPPVCTTLNAGTPSPRLRYPLCTANSSENRGWWILLHFGA